MTTIKREPELDFEDVLLIPRTGTVNSRADVSLVRTVHFKNSGASWTGVPIMVSNMDTTGTFEMALALTQYQMFTCIHKHYLLEEWVSFVADVAKFREFPGRFNPYNHIAVTIGTSDEEVSRLRELIDIAPELAFINIDIANGYIPRLTETVRNVRELFPNKTIFCGNVVTGDRVEELMDAGADVVKVGIGSGSVCTTRIKTGVGRPQLSAVIDCAARPAHTISDGGCVHVGDIAKALAAGATFVMCGSMFAGHDECAGKDVVADEEGNLLIKYYGMSSEHAMYLHNGDVLSYRTGEGKVVTLSPKGPVERTVMDILGGLRSTCTYLGTDSIEGLQADAVFQTVRRQSNESLGSNS